MKTEAEKQRELLRAQNRQKYPDVAALVDRFKECGFGDVKVKYIGPLRDETKRALERASARR